MMLPKLGIIAGGGELPAEIIRHCQTVGRPFFVIALKNHAQPSLLNTAPHAWVRLGAAGKALKLLRQNNVEELVMAGAVKRPSLITLWPDFWTLKFFLKTGANAFGDDGLLTTLINTLQDEGFTVIGSDDILPDLIAKGGTYGKVEPTPANRDDIKTGILSARELGARDIGQAVVVRGGGVIGLEDKAGTDALLNGVAPASDSSRSGVLVKVVKPQQDRRVDLPTIGPATVEGAFNAGLAGIAIEKGRALVLEQSEVIRLADEYGLFVIGVELNDEV